MAFKNFLQKSYFHLYTLWTRTNLWWPICLSLEFDRWEVLQSLQHRGPASCLSWTRPPSQTSSCACTLSGTPSGWLSWATCFAAQSSGLACCLLWTCGPELYRHSFISFHFSVEILFAYLDFPEFHWSSVSDNFYHILVLMTTFNAMASTCSTLNIDFARRGPQFLFLAFPQIEYYIIILWHGEGGGGLPSGGSDFDFLLKV